MSGLTIGLIAIAAILILLAVGVPVAFSLGVVAIAGMYVVLGKSFVLSMMTTMPYDNVSQYTFVVIPMFIFMGTIAARAGFIEELYVAAHRLTSRMRGSLFTATILASTAFAAISGSTIVSSSVFTKMALPQMMKFGYDRRISAGCIAAAGTLAALIPPSVAMVLYGILTNESIGRLLIAGIIPGLLTALFYGGGLRICLALKPHWAPANGTHYSLRQKLNGLKTIWPVGLLAALILGGIYYGLFSPSAAGAIGAGGALVIAGLRRRIRPADVTDSLFEAARITGVLFAIIIAGLLFSRFLMLSGFISAMTSVVSDSHVGTGGFILWVVGIFLILGMFIDTVSMLVVTLPILFPIAKQLGIDPIWFGIIVVKLIEIGAITPPVGLNLFAVVGAAQGRITSREMFVGIVPFVLIEAVLLTILILFPQISLWLPSKMIG